MAYIVSIYYGNMLMVQFFYPAVIQLFLMPYTYMYHKFQERDSRGPCLFPAGGVDSGLLFGDFCVGVEG